MKLMRVKSQESRVKSQDFLNYGKKIICTNSQNHSFTKSRKKTSESITNKLEMKRVCQTVLSFLVLRLLVGCQSKPAQNRQKKQKNL